jgi:hypothetical protein
MPVQPDSDPADENGASRRASPAEPGEAGDSDPQDGADVPATIDDGYEPL